MSTDNIPQVCAHVKYESAYDELGRAYLIPSATAEHLLNKGITTWTPTLTIAGQRPTAWLTVTEAAELLRTDIDGLSAEDIGLAHAKGRIAAGIQNNQFTITGSRSTRRIEPNTFNAWRLRQREREERKLDSGNDPEFRVTGIVSEKNLRNF